jgi:hypothetical protein
MFHRIKEAFLVIVQGATGYRIRLRVRIGKALNTDAKELTAPVLGRDVTIVAQTQDKALKEGKWVILHARGFSTEEEARNYGRALASILQLAALSSKLGVDVGEDKPSLHVSESWARSIGIIRPEERLAPEVHGLAVLLDDDLTRFPSMSMTAVVLSDPDQMLSALREIGAETFVQLGRAANGIRLVNLALMSSDPLAQMVLALSPIEELGQDQVWSEEQKTLIEKLAYSAEVSTDGTKDERAEVAASIRKGLFN